MVTIVMLTTTFLTKVVFGVNGYLINAEVVFCHLSSSPWIPANTHLYSPAPPPDNTSNDPSINDYNAMYLGPHLASEIKRLFTLFAIKSVYKNVSLNYYWLTFFRDANILIAYFVSFSCSDIDSLMDLVQPFLSSPLKMVAPLNLATFSLQHKARVLLQLCPGLKRYDRPLISHFNFRNVSQSKT